MKSITLKNKKGSEIILSTLGATIISLKVPNKNKSLTNVVVGLANEIEYTTIKYLKKELFLGASIGRYAGRISKNQLEIDGKIYPIYSQNDVHLHGGKEGFDKKLWTIEKIEEGKTSFVTLSYLSKHLEEGYPGNLKVFVTYTLTEKDALIIRYKATTDKKTVVNLTNHSYFNLSGDGTILDHELQLNSSSYLEVNEQLIPTGKINSVYKTPSNFTEKKNIQKEGFIGLDTTFVINKELLKASISSPKSGIKMEVYSNQPAIVIYTPLSFGDLQFKDDVNYSNYPAICFETQNYPDAPNNSQFPSSLLEPGQVYINETKFQFSTL